MKRATLVIAVLLASLFLAGCEGAHDVRLVLSGTHRVAAGEVVPGELFISDGDVFMEQGSRVDGSVYLLRGRLQVDGEIAGDLSIFGGELVLGPHTRLLGSLKTGGGRTIMDPRAYIGQEITSLVMLPEAENLSGRSLENRLIWWLPEALLLAGLAFAAVQRMPRPVGRISQALAEHPLVSGAMGLLVAMVAPALLVMMAFTVVLIPLSVLTMFLAAPVILMGWVSYGLLIGRFLNRKWRAAWSSSRQAFTGTLLLMLLLNTLEFIPWVGSMLSLLLAVTGAGAVLLTRFGLRRFVPEIEAEAGIWVYDSQE